MKNRIGLAISIAALFIVGLACNSGPATMTSFKTSSDKDGKQETTTFKAGDTLYANALVTSGAKFTVKFSLVVVDSPGAKAGDIAPGSEVKVDLPSSGTAQFHLTIPPSFQGGKFTVNAELIDDKGEKKDTKTAAVTITAGSGSTPAAPPSKSDDKDKDDDN